MPLGDHGTTQSMIAICKYVWHRPSDTPAVQHANASSHGIYDMRGYDTRGESACISIRLIEIRSMASERAGRGGRFPSGYARTSHAWMRLPRSRRKYSTHEQIPTPLVGHSRGARPSPHITPISDPFPGDSDSWGYVPGPLTGDIGRGPSTVARSPGRTPPNSQRRNAHSRCVVGWVESGYVERGAHDTRDLSSCLVTPTTSSGECTAGVMAGKHAGVCTAGAMAGNDTGECTVGVMAGNHAGECTVGVMAGNHAGVCTGGRDGR